MEIALSIRTVTVFAMSLKFRVASTRRLAITSQQQRMRWNASTKKTVMIAMATALQMPMATEFVMNLKLWVAPMQQLVIMMKRTQTRMVHAITVHVVSH